MPHQEAPSRKRSSVSADAPSAVRLVVEHLRSCTSSWSIGTLGAIGEFNRDPGEPFEKYGMTVVTSRGGLRFSPHERITPRAYELISARADVWHHGVMFCVPEKSAQMSGRTVITEFGYDHEAIRVDDRRDILFDLGVGGATSEFCIRASTPGLVEALRAHSGTALLDARCLWDRLIKESPHRVIRSRLGRVEVYQKIAKHGERTPIGPHTHLIEKLLWMDRSHSANLPVPEGMLPVLYLYPPNPVQHENGQLKPFSREDHETFQELLERFGDPEAWFAKKLLFQTVKNRVKLNSCALPSTRPARIAWRIAMRQLRYA